MVEQLLARKDPARMLQEMPQQAEFGRAEMDRLAGARDPMRREIHRDIGIAQHLFARIRLGAPDTARSRATSSLGLNGLTT